MRRLTSAQRRRRRGFWLWLISLAVVALATYWWTAREAPLWRYDLPQDPLTAAPADYDWTQLPPPAFPIPPQADYLRGFKIVLDPGHGGRKHKKGWKMGPTGLREAEVNLRVARYLREFLTAAGAEVTLTRDGDYYLDRDNSADLRQRAAIANEQRADLLLSIHHNGGPEAANYTMVFYHGEPDDRPASQDAARHVLAGLDEALRLGRAIPRPLTSDHQIFADDGFAILRHADVPAVLTESSFHSNPEQEALLRDPVYNRREAYGLFRGLVNWARGGLPRVRLSDPADGVVSPGQTIRVELDDGVTGRAGAPGVPTIRVDSILLRLNGELIGAHITDDDALLIDLAPTLRRGVHTLWIDFETIYGHHVLHPELPLSVR